MAAAASRWHGQSVTRERILRIAIRLVFVLAAYLAFAAAWDYRHLPAWDGGLVIDERCGHLVSIEDDYFPSSLLLQRTARQQDRKPAEFIRVPHPFKHIKGPGDRLCSRGLR